MTSVIVVGSVVLLSCVKQAPMHHVVQFSPLVLACTYVHTYYYTPQVLLHSTCVIGPHCVLSYVLHSTCGIVPHSVSFIVFVLYLLYVSGMCYTIPLHMCCIPVQVQTLFSSWLQTRMVLGENRSSSSCPPTARTELGGVSVCTFVCIHTYCMCVDPCITQTVCMFVHVFLRVCMRVCSSLAATQPGLVSSLLLEV